MFLGACFPQECNEGVGFVKHMGRSGRLGSVLFQDGDWVGDTDETATKPIVCAYEYGVPQASG